MTDQPAEQGELSYEAAREELVEVVRRLESGGTNLEESLALWERGERLARICQDWLDGAKQRLDAAMRADQSPDRSDDQADDRS
jgi:exodeoxyribonuclease VII small subunit